MPAKTEYTPEYTQTGDTEQLKTETGASNCHQISCPTTWQGTNMAWIEASMG